MDPQAIKLDSFNPEEIDFDLNNPRGETEEMITNDKSFHSLVRSIRAFGILEPIIIKDNPEKAGRYILVDGERRLRAAKSIKSKIVPAILIDRELDGQVIAYHIHMLRQQWQTSAETKSIKRIVSSIEKETPNLSETDIKKKIKEITEAPKSRINDLYILIKYEDKYIDLVNEKRLDMSYLIQGQTSFVNRIVNNYPDILSEFPESRIRSIIAEKSCRGLVPGTRFWMDTFKDVFVYEYNKQIENYLVEFLEDSGMSAQELLDKILPIITESQADKSNQQNKDNSSYSERKNENSNETDQNQSNKGKGKDQNKSRESTGGATYTRNGMPQNSLDYAVNKLSKKQQTSIKDIREKFDRIGKSFSKEEKEYLAEALHCLEMQCFKAAVLMIWATGISRVLSFISKDISDFIVSSQTMRTSNKSFYKNHCMNFQLNATTIDDIRHASKDLQLFCYLTFRTCLDESQFRKLKHNYETRCDCAHPTEIELKVNETLVVFENVLELIISNPRIK